MKPTIYGYVGNGKLGSLLSGRPNFVFIDCDITNINSIKKTYKSVDVLVNCAAVSSIDVCETDDRFAFRVNVRGADNLMQIYGTRVLNISSDYVFGGWAMFPPTEKTKPNPINAYGLTKMIMEDLAVNTYGAKVLRLSRTIHPSDPDITGILHDLGNHTRVGIPPFHRNYLTRSQAVNGIEFAVRNFSMLPPIVNYGAKKATSFHDLMSRIATRLGISTHKLLGRRKYDAQQSPRPQKAGFHTWLATSLGFPMYDIDEVVREFCANVS